MKCQNLIPRQSVRRHQADHLLFISNTRNNVNSIPEPGKVYEVIRPFSTLAGVSYDVGDHLELIEPTDRNPFGFTSKLRNWVVKCKHFSPPDDQTVWSGIYLMIESGYIRAIETGTYRD